MPSVAGRRLPDHTAMIGWCRGALATTCLCGAVLLSGCADRIGEITELAGRTMGTGYSIKLTGLPDGVTPARLQEAVTQRLDEIDGQMSTYRADSDLTRFNRTHSTDWQPVPRPLVELVHRARQISERTDGHYDVTVGPLVNLWGFGNSGSRASPPADEEIARQLDRVGYRHLTTRAFPPAMRKAVAGLEVDLSSIAKGWAVDELAGVLEAHGIEDYLVEIGGELRARGEKADGRPWQIAIERPVDDGRAIQRVVRLNDMAVATSGDYRNFFEDGGQRYSHTIDPSTGRPVRHRLASVTVFAEDCAGADAWATALMSLGDRLAPALADTLGMKALFIIREQAGFREHPTSALTAAGLISPPSS